MGERVIPVGLALGLAAVACLAAPASAAAQIKPRAGYFAGQEADRTTPMPVSFTVSKNRKKVVSFTGQAVVKAGCTNNIQSFQAPRAPMPIKAKGRFTRSSTNYPQKGVRVTVTGTFTSATKANGHITIHFANIRGCNASRVFTARRTAATAPTAGA
jgi:hypothetical protein